MTISIGNMTRKSLGLAILTCVVAGTASVAPAGKAWADGRQGPTTLNVIQGPTTFISRSSAPAVDATNNSGLTSSGIGVRGTSPSYVGVAGYSTSYVGVFGRSLSDRGTSGIGPVAGLYGASEDAAGNLNSGDGVHGISGSGAGVHGTAGSAGRGGVFEGGAAQLRLVPSSSSSLPAQGQHPGDLLVLPDPSVSNLFHLYFYNGYGWVQVA